MPSRNSATYTLPPAPAHLRATSRPAQRHAPSVRIREKLPRLSPGPIRPGYSVLATSVCVAAGLNSKPRNWVSALKSKGLLELTCAPSSAVEVMRRGTEAGEMESPPGLLNSSAVASFGSVGVP
jgi:hypothetical protein